MSKQPTGYVLPDGRVRISVALKRETFDRVRELARRDDKPFSETVELALRTGLFDIEESDKLEPAT